MSHQDDPTHRPDSSPDSPAAAPSGDSAGTPSSTPAAAGLDPRRLQQLSPQERRKLLAQWMERKAAKPRFYPLSFAQQRLWFVDQLEGPSPRYTMHQALRLESSPHAPLDLRRLELAIQRVIARHESLRTTFVTTGDQPVQAVSPRARFRLPVVEATGVNSEDLESLLLEAVARPFALDRGPLLRALLVVEGPYRHVLQVTVHHIVSDVWSSVLFLSEVSALYRALGTNEDPGLAPLKVSYGAFARWQRKQLEGASLERLLAYWTGHLQGAPKVLELPWDHPRPATPTDAGALHPFRLEPALAERVMAVAKGRGATPYMVLLASFYALLYRLSGQRDLVLGTPVAGRTRPEVEGLVGLFVNTLALRVQLDSETSPAVLLERVERTTLGAFDHQELPLEKLVEALAPERDLSHHPIFQVVFQLQTAGAPKLDLGGVEATPMDVDPGTTTFDLTLYLESQEDGSLRAFFQYASSLFDAETLERMAGWYENLLSGFLGAVEGAAEGVVEGAAEEAGASPFLGTLTLLAGSERQQLVEELNSHRRPYVRGPGAGWVLHELFRAQVEETPEAVAVAYEDRALSYRQLDQRARHLAQYLLQRGVGPDVPVAVCLERSPELVVALLGILYAGGAYVPVDPGYPAERVAYMLENCGAPAVVTTQALAADLGSVVAAAATVCLDADWSEIAATDPEAPLPAVGEHHSAYLLYTSGSTGQPKGVVISHGAIGHHMLWWQDTYPLNAEDRVLQKTPMSFDASVWEFWAPLLVGARLEIAEPGGHMDPAYLLRTLRERKITILQVVPSLLRAMLDYGDAADAALRGARSSSRMPALGGGLDCCPKLRMMFCGGEPLDADLVERFHVTSRAQLHNLYGPTEGTIHAATWAADRVLTDRVIPIGRPIANGQAYVVDPRFRLVPRGVPGELWIGGPNLARAYRRRPALTAAAFVPNPFAANPGERLYRTGDLVRWLPSGDLVYLGRIDHQVKVRGLRIELGEIEARLKSHPQVGLAVVVLSRELPGGEGLAAYLAMADLFDDEGLQRSAAVAAERIAELKELVAQQLPEYMVPAHFELLPTLPLTPNGKVDRKALPRPSVEAAAIPAGRPPVTATERSLAEIWAQLLGRSEVGADDDFFSLGGHSLLATQVIARVRRHFGIEVPVAELFARPTVAALAAWMDASSSAAGGRTGASGAAPTSRRAASALPTSAPQKSAAALAPEEAALTAPERPERLPLSYAQERLWFLDRMQGGGAVYNIPGVLELRGPLDIAALSRALGAVEARHESLRTTFATAGGDAWQVVAAPSAAPRSLPTVCFAGLGGDAAEGLAVDLARRDFDLAVGPLWKTVLLRLSAHHHRLVVCFHHIVSDGWSLGVFFHELASFYNGFLDGANEDPATLVEPLPLQYPDFALWQRQWLESGEALERQLGFWRRNLADPLEVLELPADRPRPAVQSFHGSFINFPLPALSGGSLALATEQLGRRLEATAFVITLAAFDALLTRVTGKTDLPVGTPVANRDRVELEPLVGFFVNSLVVRVDADVDSSGEVPSFADLVSRVRRATLEAYAHREVPFERLVEELRPSRDLSHAPLFQLLFTLQNRVRETPTLRDLEARVEALDAGAAKFDLGLYVSETAEGLEGTLEYNSDLFDRSTAERMAGWYSTLLAAAVAEPERRLVDLPLLSAGERRQVVEEWNATGRDYGRARCLHHLFEERAEEHPERIALSFGEHSLSYASLDRRAEELAQRLARFGVGSDQLVGIAMERSFELVVALMAILKAGGAYVPLDPEYPADRLSFMMEDSGVRVLLSLGRHREVLPTVEGVETLWIDELEAPDAAAAPLPLAGRLTRRDNLAYMIYTSGSTGRPKGAMNSHRAIFNRLLWMQETYGLGEQDRVLQKTPKSFDVSVWEFFWPLITGAHLVLAAPGEHRDPRALAATIRRTGITTLHFVPSMLQVFLEQDGLERLSSVRRVICSGEALTADLRDRFFRRLPPQAELHNLYGPTEAAIDVTWWQCEPRTGRSAVPIGSPVANTEVYVLDPHLRPTPVGVPGELHIGGVQLARGYHDRPALTASRFIPDPYGQPGDRLYKTGDEVAWNAEGVVDFLGRIDFQVKLRGFRIELGEIESALTGEDSVREAVVVARRREDGDQQLVAYLVPVPTSGADGVASGGEGEILEDFDPAPLREALLETLPDYMVPAIFVPLAALPLSPNGKVDRKRLPDPPARRRGASSREAATQGPAAVGEAPRSELGRAIAEMWQELLQVDSVQLDDSFFDLGGHSLLLVKVQARLEALGEKVPTLVELFQYPTIRSLVDFLRPGAEAAATPLTWGVAGVDLGGPIAIVGVAGRFPGAATVEEFWQLLQDGVEGLERFDPAEAERDVFAGSDPEHPDFVPVAGPVAEVEYFDAAFFGYNPQEAAVMDPQQRLFLECAWEALEDAGHGGDGGPGRGRGAVGVYAGVGMNTYLHANLLANPAMMATAGAYQVMLGNDKDFLPTRVAYKLDLTGPAITVQTACSTSLVAVHLAVQSLRTGECSMALAGGVTVRVPQHAGYVYQPAMINSPDGRCRAFDADAAGTVGGNGVAVVALRRLADAEADGDPIYAVIRGSALNNDGSLKVGYTAPSVEGQAEVIGRALADGDVDPATVGYIEAHGTGTELGDPIEMAALRQAFASSFQNGSFQNGSFQNGRSQGGQAEGAGSEAEAFCTVGSLKSNFGHMDTAAGAAGLIKAALVLERGYIPPTLHFQTPNPKLGLEGSPFTIAAEGRPWPAAEGEDAAPRRAGVSSFGIGGTNAHVVLEEAPPVAPALPSAHGAELLVLSAKSAEALEQGSQRLADWLQHQQQQHQQQGDQQQRPPEGSEAWGLGDLADVAFTLQIGRARFPHRRAMVARDTADAITLLRGEAPKRLLGRRSEARQAAVTFLFPGQGSQHAGMGRGLYDREAVYRRAVDEACELLLEPLEGVDLRSLLHPEGAADGEAYAAAQETLRQTRYTQPALFVVEHALAQLWMSWGVEPAVMIGHSVGEWVAATLAGTFDLADALHLVALRGRLMGSMEPGAMLSLPLGESGAQEQLAAFAAAEAAASADGLEIAALNAPDLTAVAGPIAAVEAFGEFLRRRSIDGRRLVTSHAFHSSMMEPAVEELVAAVAKVGPREPQIPFVSNPSGHFIRPEEAQDPGYWGRQMRAAVRFADGLAALLEDPEGVLLEVGPGRSVSTMIRRFQDAARGRSVVTSLPAPKVALSRGAEADGEAVLEAAGRLWLSGVTLDWAGFHSPVPRRRRHLPTYAFQRQRYWVEPAAHSAGATGLGVDPHAKIKDLAQWTHVPSWQPLPSAPLPSATDLAEMGPWLLFAAGSAPPPAADAAADPLAAATGPVAALARRLEAGGARVTVVWRGDRFAPLGSRLFTVPAEGVGGYRQLLETLEGRSLSPRRVVHGWTLESLQDAQEEWRSEVLENGLQQGFASLLGLAQGLAALTVPGEEEQTPVHLTVLSHGLLRLDDRDALRPSVAALQGPLWVIPQEHPNLALRAVDWDSRVSSGVEAAGAQELSSQGLDRLLSEIASEESEMTARLVAWRGGRRWGRRWQPLVLPEITQSKVPESEATEAVAREQEIFPPPGPVMITGGLGQVGLSLASALVSAAPPQQPARLVLLGRSALPPRQEWPAILDAGGSVASRLAAVEALEAQGAEVLTLAADVSDEAAMERAVAEGRERFGPLAAVIHAAGVVGEKAFTPLEMLDPDRVEEQMGAKVRGLLVLRRVLRNEPLRWLAVTSSIAGVVGGRFFTAYAAASAAVDAYVEAAVAEGEPWLTVDWDGWRFNVGAGEDGAATDGAPTDKASSAVAALQEVALTADEGAAVLRRLLSAEAWPQDGRVAVSTTPLEPRLQRWLDLESLRAEVRAAAGDEASAEGGREDGALRFQRPDLPTPYVAPRNPTERIVAREWGQLLSLESVGIHDDFFELGGHSLLATRLLARLRASLGLELSLAQILENPTVAEQAARVDPEAVAGLDSESLGATSSPSSTSPSSTSAPSPSTKVEGGASQIAENAPAEAKRGAGVTDHSLGVAPPLGPVSRQQRLPVSFSQQRVWFLQKYDPESTAYSLPAAIRLRGALDVDILRRCFDALVSRHEILRTTLDEDADGPIQRIHQPTPQPLPEIDLSELSAEQQEGEVYRIAISDAERPFDLGHGPLVRNTVVRLAPEDHVFVSNSHHVVTDGWSGGLFVSELATLYQAWSQGLEPKLPELPLQYADFAVWERQWLSGEVMASLERFWRTRLQGLPETSAPPPDRPRVEGSAPAARTTFEVPAATVEGLSQLARRHGTTLFAAAVAGLQATIGRVSGQLDVAIGTPAANRHRPGAELLLGMFINTLVLRGRLEGRPGFGELLERAKVETVGAQTHQEMPFGELVALLGPRRRAGAQPFFQVMMAFNQEPPTDPEFAGLDLELLDLDSRRDHALFDLSIGLTVSRDGALEGSVQYDRALYDAGTVDRFLRWYRRLLESATDSPETPFELLPLLEESEVKALTLAESLPLLRRGELPVPERRRLSQAAELADVATARARVLSPSGISSALPGAPGEIELCGTDSTARPTGIRGRLLLVGEGSRLVLTQPAPEIGYEPVEETGRRQRQRQEAEERWSEVSSRTRQLSANQLQMLKQRLAGRGEGKAATDSPADPSVVAEVPAPPARSRKPTPAQQHLVRIETAGAGDPFFCVHPIAGDVTYYVELAREMGGERPFVGLQASGLDDRESPAERIEVMARRYLAAIREVQPGGVYLLGGWSMGAVVAYEMARELERAGETVGALVLIGPSVPGHTGTVDTLDRASIIRRLLKDLEILSGGPLDISWIDLLKRDEEEQLSYLFEQARRSSTAFASLAGASPRGLFEVYRSNLDALRSYQPTPCESPAALLLPEHRGEDGVDAETFWRQLLGAEVDQREVPGDHSTMLRQPNLRLLAAALREILGRAVPTAG
ncbi:MAG: amino acid adenylation domain-containing protein [Acidobacteriota bacterium]